MALDPASRARFNLERAVILLLDETPVGMAILVQIVTGLGAKQLHRCTSVEQAQEVAMTHQLDMAIVDSLSPSGAGYDFVSWLRQTPKEPNCYIPVLVTTGHTPARDVTRARDCGGHILVKKPIAPVVMLERIIWVSKEGRTFLYSDGYIGPDRRFRDEPPADGIGRRRGDALAPESADTADTADTAETADAADVAETAVQEREAS